MDQTKFKASADDKLNATKMIVSSFDRVENIVEKGEIAHYEQFLLFPQCFQKACFPGASKGVVVWEWVKSSNYRSIFVFHSSYHTKIWFAGQFQH